MHFADWELAVTLVYTWRQMRLVAHSQCGADIEPWTRELILLCNRYSVVQKYGHSCEKEWENFREPRLHYSLTRCVTICHKGREYCTYIVPVEQ